MRADLHMHSVHSDGTLPVRKLLDYAKSKRLDIISLTDHDSTLGVNEAIKYGETINLKVIPGIELSTVRNGESIHVLGYFKDRVPENVLKFSEEQHKYRRNRIYQMALNVEKIHGVKIDYERLMKPVGTITRAHLVREIHLSNPELEKEYIFNNFLKEDCPGYIHSTKMATEDGIKFLHDEGALVVIAHPVLLKKNELLDIINPMVDGIEGIYPKNKPIDELRFREIAKKHNLVITAGSDYHGVVDYSHEDMAFNVLTGEDLELFLERLDQR